MPLILYTPKEASLRIADRVRSERLARGWTQAEMAIRTRIPVMTYRLFERTGQISLERLLTIASVFGRLGEWDGIMQPRAARSIEEIIMRRPVRQRGKRRKSLPHTPDGGSQ